MPLFGLTRCGRKSPPLAVSFANSGAMKALAARRLALRRLDCLRFGLAMGGGSLGVRGACGQTPSRLVKGEGVKGWVLAGQAPYLKGSDSVCRGRDGRPARPGLREAQSFGTDAPGRASLPIFFKLRHCHLKPGSEEKPRGQRRRR